MSWNLQVYKEHFLRAVMLGRYGRASQAAYPDAYIFRLLASAYELIQRDWQLVRTRYDTGTLLSGASTFQFSLVMSNSFQALRLRSAANVLSDPLTRKDWQEFTRLSSSGETGTPLYWALDPGSGSLIHFYPVPDANYTIVADFTAWLSPAERIFNLASPTATATYGSTAVTLSAEPPSGMCVVGDEFGVVPTTQTDGTAITGASPASWYTITDVATEGDPEVTTLTLDRAYGGSTVSGARFIAAQVPPLEIAFPGKLQMAPVYMALALHYEASSQAAADYYRQLALSLITPADDAASVSVAPNYAAFAVVRSF